MKIAGASTLEGVSARTWQEYAQDVQIGLPLVRRRIGEISEAAAARAGPVSRELADKGFDTDKLAKIIRDRAGAVARSIARPT